ncbi:AfsR/SARP family transcriptional regulator [Streptomyces sp. NPDC053541]|uniref:AfsR/SARP family transcriptional regulator n=1 Tax=Streptomyces sp. NPDC053541 TaxID=3365709 RepID=UPI0037D5C28C
MEFRLLGTVSITAEAGELPLGPAKRRSVLAALLLRANSVVPVDRLIDTVWAEDPPARARTVVQGHVSRLRALFEQGGADDYGVELATRSQAYELRMPDQLLDTHRFEELVQLAGHQKHPGDAVLMLREALALWRGPALTGTVASEPLLVAAQALEETRLVTVEQLAAAYGRLGEHTKAAAVLRAEAAANPLRESLTAALMLSLYRAGHQSDALDCYHRTRGLLADELGVDPGPALRAAYEAVLRGLPTAGPQTVAIAEGPDRGERSDRPAAGTDGTAPTGEFTPSAAPRRGAGASPARTAGRPAVTGPGDAAEAAGHPGVPGPGAGVPAAEPPFAGTAIGPGLPRGGTPEWPAPDLLPRTPRGFLGRERELDELDAAVADARVAIVTGPAGVGKTALALQWAHLSAPRYPDGVLYADLRGFSTDEGLDTVDVLREFLHALGVPPGRVPESPTAAAALYRSLTEDRALLVVLDNVRAADRAGPLLPAGARSAAVVTSRLRLGGLVVSELARPVPLGVLGVDESAVLLAAAVGADRVAAEPAAARLLASLCDGLPLALRVTAAQLAARPHWRLADLAAELADEQRRLALLSVGCAGPDGQGVAAALHLTVHGLPPEAARLFRQIGALPGPDLDRNAAAALLERPPAVAAEALERLCDAHLLTEYAPGRHTLHDLVRLYARGLRPDDEALLRLLDHYMVTAMAATKTAEPDDLPCCTLPEGARRPPATPHFAGRDAALLWYAAERDNLAAAVAAARAAGHHDRAWRLALLQWPYMLWNSHDGWVPLLESAVDSAAREDDPDAESRARALLGWLLTQDGRLREALVHLRLAPDLAARAGEPSSEATALVNLAIALDTTSGVTAESLAHTARAIALVQGGDDVITELLALEHRAQQLLAAGDPAGSLDCARRGLALDGDTVNGLLGVRHSMLTATMGAALLDLGEHAAAETALTLARELGLSHGHKETVERADAELRRLRAAVGGVPGSA